MAAMATPRPDPGLEIEPHDVEEVVRIARGIATAVAPAEGLTDLQAALLGAIASSLTGYDIDYQALEPLGPEELGAALADHDVDFRQRIVHHMVLGELVLRPIPMEVAFRVAQYAQALDIQDDFVRVARRYAQGAYGLAWIDLQRSGFVEHVAETDTEAITTKRGARTALDPAEVDAELEARWVAFRDLPEGSLGRTVVAMYDGRGFTLPGAPGGAPEYLAQHDFVHVLADYGTNLPGELEVFSFIGRADPDPKGFAWLATLIGLFETGYVEDTGFFHRDTREHNLRRSGMDVRIADAIRRGKLVSQRCNRDLFELDYYALAELPVPEVRERLQFPTKSAVALAHGSPGAFDRAGMSAIQQRYADEHAGRQSSEQGTVES
jgi:hypothetical protein